MSSENQFLDLNSFDKLQFIGKGSFGKVFCVKEKETGSIFAAKILNPDSSEDAQSFCLNLLREVNIISKLNHPSILKFIGYSPIDFKKNTKSVLVTEFIPNGSLDQIIALEKQNKSNKYWDDTKKLINIYGIASAMSYLHSHNILHRDLKPENILEDEYLFPKIADFGLSKVSHQNEKSMSLKSQTGIKGTPIYMAPEIWKNGEYTKAGDVYAFSLIVYEILTTETPFQNFNTVQFLMEVAQKGSRPKFTKPILPSFKELIEKCWSDDINERLPFEIIVQKLKTEPGFLSEKVVKDDFFKYVEFIDQYHTTFDPNKKDN